MPLAPNPSGIPTDPSANLSPEDQKLVAQLKEAQEIQQAYLRQAFRWLIDYVASYFPEDQLAMEDQGRDVHFLHVVLEQGKPLGVLVYRLPKFPDKEALYKDLSEEYRGELGMPEVIFVDAETGKFEGDAVSEGDRIHYEIPAENLTTRIGTLRDELKRRARVRQLRESV
jgi:hypothetical protein